MTDQYNWSTDTVTLDSSLTSSTSITLAPGWTTSAGTSYDFGNLTIGASNGVSGTWGSWSNETSGKISLSGENADIDINGISLKQTLQDIQDRLNILRPNKELESEWDQLRELGEQYRKLEQELIEKQRMWNTLKK